MDKLHTALIDELISMQGVEDDADNYKRWWKDEEKRADALEQENITLKASITELEELLQDCCENTRS